MPRVAVRGAAARIGEQLRSVAMPPPLDDLAAIARLPHRGQLPREMDDSIAGDLERARRAVAGVATRQAEIRQEREAAVVAWRWAREGSDLYCPQPLYRQRFGQPEPQLLAHAPAQPRDEQQYGYDSDARVLYRARGGGSSPARLLRRVEDRLVELLPRVVREHAGGEAIYCLVLHYELEWPLPPLVAVGVDAERRRWLRTIVDAPASRLTVCNPAEFGGYRGQSLGGALVDVDRELAGALGEVPAGGDGWAARWARDARSGGAALAAPGSGGGRGGHR